MALFSVVRRSNEQEPKALHIGTCEECKDYIRSKKNWNRYDILSHTTGRLVSYVL